MEFPRQARHPMNRRSRAGADGRAAAGQRMPNRTEGPVGSRAGKPPYRRRPGKGEPDPAEHGSAAEASWATSLATRRSMQANRRRDTMPELAIRRLVHARGLRYRVDARPLPDARHTADLIFPRARVAVFIDGCWWHGCPDHYRPPSSNTGYWATKVTRNRERDRLADETLSAAGWAVIRVWEHQPPESVARFIEVTVRERAAPATSKAAMPQR